MKLLNFSHSLTQTALEEIKQYFNIENIEVLQIPTNLNLNEDLEPQIETIIAGIGISSVEWQTEDLLINPPGMSPATAIVIAALHGRMGYFPRIMRLIQRDGTFHLAEIVDLQKTRNDARTQRF